MRHYAKGVLGVPRRVLTSVTVAGGVLYTLTVEVDAKRLETAEGDALRRSAESLSIAAEYA